MSADTRSELSRFRSVQFGVVRPGSTDNAEVGGSIPPSPTETAPLKLFQSRSPSLRVEDVLSSPYVVIGTARQIAQQLDEQPIS